jgi:hypothetical protein
VSKSRSNSVINEPYVKAKSAAFAFSIFDHKAAPAAAEVVVLDISKMWDRRKRESKKRVICGIT